MTTTLGGQQIFQSGGQQYLIVNKALQGSGGRIQIVDQPETTGTRENVNVLGKKSHSNIDTKRYQGHQKTISRFWKVFKTIRHFIETLDLP